MFDSNPSPTHALEVKIDRAGTYYIAKAIYLNANVKRNPKECWRVVHSGCRYTLGLNVRIVLYDERYQAEGADVQFLSRSKP